jgi:hypothetical protein
MVIGKKGKIVTETVRLSPGRADTPILQSTTSTHAETRLPGKAEGVDWEARKKQG